jgi:hypothetical protein
MMSADTVSPPVAPRLSEGERILNAFIAPSKTFNDVRRKPRWWVPWLLISIVSLAFIAVVGQKVGFEQIVRNEIAKSSRAEQFDRLPPEQQARQMQVTLTVTKLLSYAVPITSLLVFIIVAAVLMATFNFGAGAEIPFQTSLAVVIYGWLPSMVSGLLGIVSLLAGADPEGFNIRNPVASNPAYFMDPTQHKFLYGLASALDVFSFWTIVLMAIGFSCVSKLKRSTTFGVILAWYLLLKIVSAAISGLG